MKTIKWFAASRKWSGASHIVFSDIICYFTVNKAPKCWKPRAKFCLKQSELPSDLTEEETQEEPHDITREGENVVGRIHTVNPLERESYHLQTPFLHVSGATSFAEKESVEGEAYPTYREACPQCGLLSEDAE